METEKSSRIILLSAVIAIAASLLTAQFTRPEYSVSSPVKSESIYERVLRTGKIRYGYIIYYPALIKDPNTAQLSGIFYDFMNEIGRKLSLEVEWIEETGWANFVNDLKKDRFDNDVSILNDPAYTIVTIDGSTPDLIKDADFPDASEQPLTELSPYSDLALSVATNKADATFLEKYIANQFLENNPNTIKQVGQPIRYFGNVMWVKKGQENFLSMINTSIEEIHGTNFLQKLFEKYNVPQGSYLMPNPPYKEN